MVILGLGTNLGDRLNNLRDALKLIKTIPELSVKQVSPVYISDALLPENAPPAWNKSYLNLALRCETTLSPHELLLKTQKIETEMGRTAKANWGPRIIDIDLLAWDDLTVLDEKLQIPHKELMHRPWALWPLLDVAPFWNTTFENKWGSRFSGEAPFHTRQIAQRIDTPALVGIINVTPDSFSDGGKYCDPVSAVKLAKQLVLDGAEILDIGAEATNPRATAISPEEEWSRLAPVLKAILEESSQMIIPPKISIDTRHALVAKHALDLGVAWINDVSGAEDPAMREVIINSACDVVIMHHLGIPVDRNKILDLDKNPVDQVLHWGEKRLNELIQLGVRKDRIIFDVGIGFGKNPQQCLTLIKNIDQFHPLGTRLLVGHSRKIFLGEFTDKKFAERDIETVMVSMFLAEKGMDYLRVHDVEMHAKAFKVKKSLF